jgi:hypothetical protein
MNNLQSGCRALLHTVTHEPVARWLAPRFGIPSHKYCTVLYCNLTCTGLPLSRNFGNKFSLLKREQKLLKQQPAAAYDSA